MSPADGSLAEVCAHGWLTPTGQFAANRAAVAEAIDARWLGPSLYSSLAWATLCPLAPSDRAGDPEGGTGDRDGRRSEVVASEAKPLRGTP